MVLTINSSYYLNSVKKLMDVMVKFGVLFEVQTEFLNVIQSSFGFKGLICESNKKMVK
jgi:hypothetical protein